MIIMLIISVISFSVGVTTIAATALGQDTGSGVNDDNNNTNNGIQNYSELELIEAARNEALAAIKLAEESGGDVSSLVARFNDALLLLNESEESSTSSCTDSRGNSIDCSVEANRLFISIISEASLLNNEQVKGVTNPIIYASLAVISLIFAIVLTLSYRYWKSWSTRRLLNLNVQYPSRSAREK